MIHQHINNKKKDPRKRKLLVLTTTFPRWKDDHEPPFVFELCKRLNNFEIHIISPHAKGSKRYEVLEGLHVHRFRYAPKQIETLAFNGGIAANLKSFRWKFLLLPYFLLAQFLLAYKVAKKNKIRIIHAHWFIPTGLIGVALKKTLPENPFLLVTAHGGDVFQLAQSPFKKLRRWISTKADAVTVVSKAISDQGHKERWASKTIATIPMGVDLKNTFKPTNHKLDNQTLVFIGRLVPKKGALYLVEAMQKVVKEFPTCKLIITGHGPQQQAIITRINELSLKQHIELTGRYHLSELPKILHRGSIAVLPFNQADDGDAEGFGLTAIEIMGCGLPLVIGDVPAVHDFAKEGHTALLVDPRNINSLADKIVLLLNDKTLQMKLSKNAREYCLQHYDWQIIAKKYTQILANDHSTAD